MLLAEANQWPEDAAPYLAKGRMPHGLSFPRDAPALHRAETEDRLSLIDIHNRRPHPGLCQWGIFLR